MKHVIHLEECAPELNGGWQTMPYRDALALGASMCPETKYMEDELLAYEEVWVEAVTDPKGNITTMVEGTADHGTTYVIRHDGKDVAVVMPYGEYRRMVDRLDALSGES